MKTLQFGQQIIVLLNTGNVFTGCKVAYSVSLHIIMQEVGFSELQICNSKSIAQFQGITSQEDQRNCGNELSADQ